MKKFPLIIAVLLLLIAPHADAKVLSHPVKVIATMSILGDFAKQVGGNQVVVYSLVKPDVTTYDYQPGDGDRISVERSDVLITNGLGLEGWVAPILQASKEQVRVLQASKNVRPRNSPHGGLDPHAWMDVKNAIQYVQDICAEFVAIDPLNAQEYKDNTEAYVFQLKKLDRWIMLQMGRLPEDRRSFALTHDSFAYYAAAYGLKPLPVLPVEIPPHASASDYPEVLEAMKKNKVSLLFDENVGGTRLIDEVKALTGATYAGRLYASALSKDEAGKSYVDMMKSNTDLIFKALMPVSKDSSKAQ
jgi:zinc/manganese transport system substrate-binding protein